MSKFSTVSLKKFYNASASDAYHWSKSTHEAIKELPFNKNAFWGIPFDFSENLSNNSKNLIVLNSKTNKKIIPVGRKSRYMIFAHFCDSKSLENELGQSDDYLNPVVTQPGEHLADYVITYSNGLTQSTKLRRRFEINQIRTRMQSGFSSRQHQDLTSLNFRGPYPDNSWGRWQTGVFVGDPPKSGRTAAKDDYTTRSMPPASWSIFALKLHHPENPIKNVTIKSFANVSIGIGAVTLYQGESHPLRHMPLETVEITHKDGTSPKEITLDTGVIARNRTLKKISGDKWLSEPLKGWGENLEDDLGVTAIDISATGDASINVDGSVIEVKDLYANQTSSSRDGKVDARIISPKRTWVHGKIIDAKTRETLAARIHFRSSEGRYFPPYGHTHEVNDNWFEDYGADLLLGDTQYAYVDGTFQGELPVGEVYVEVSKGFEYLPVRKKLKISPGQKHLEIELSRSSNLAKNGWVTADTHVHFLSTETARLEADAEDINVINLLAAQWGDLYTNIGDLTGKLSGSSDSKTIVWVGTENRQHFLGHISLMGGQGNPVFPLSTSGPSEGYIGDPTVTSMSSWADEVRKKEGLAIVPHFPFPHSEVLAEVILGKVDGLEIRDFHVPSMDTFAVHEWYRLLNCGYRVPCVGGTDKMSASMPVGGVRTYANIGDEEFSYSAWASAVKKGRTYTTSGPLIDLSVEGLTLGDDLQLPGHGGKISVSATASCFAPINKLEIVFNGNVIFSESSKNGTFSLSINEDIEITSSGWIAARVLSLHKAWHVWPVHLSGHTSPIYITVGNDEVFNPVIGKYLITTMEGGVEWLETLATPSNPKQMDSIKGIFETAIKHVEIKSNRTKHKHHHH